MILQNNDNNNYNNNNDSGQVKKFGLIKGTNGQTRNWSKSNSHKHINKINVKSKIITKNRH